MMAEINEVSPDLKDKLLELSDKWLNIARQHWLASDHEKKLSKQGNDRKADLARYRKSRALDMTRCAQELKEALLSHASR